MSELSQLSWRPDFARMAPRVRELSVAGDYDRFASVEAAQIGQTDAGRAACPLRPGLRPGHLPQTPSLCSVEGEETAVAGVSPPRSEATLGGVPAKPARGDSAGHQNSLLALFENPVGGVVSHLDSEQQKGKDSNVTADQRDF